MSIGALFVWLWSLALAPAAGLSPPPQSDVAIVLGAGAPPVGWANPLLVERVCRGVFDFRAGTAKALLMSGGYTVGHIAEAEMMRAVAVMAGVPEGKIWLENAAVNTVENAAFSLRLARSKGALRASIVTHRSHMPWAMQTFRAAGTDYWVSLSTAEADGARTPACFPRAEALALSATADMLIIDVTEEEPFEAVLERPVDVPSPALTLAALRGAAAYHAGRAKRLYFAIPEPSTGTASVGRGSAHGHFSRTELARVLASALGVALDDIYISSGRRLSEMPGAVEPAQDPWLRIPGAKLAVWAPPERLVWWQTRLKTGLNALLPPAEFLAR